MNRIHISAAIRRGLIEAIATSAGWRGAAGSFPRPFAAASLKRVSGGHSEFFGLTFPRPFAAASLKRGNLNQWP